MAAGPVGPHVYHPELGATSDPLPGAWDRTRFDNTSKPNSKNNHGQPTNVNVTNIHTAGDTVICDVWFGASGIEDRPGLVVEQRSQAHAGPTRGPVRVACNLPKAGASPSGAL